MNRFFISFFGTLLIVIGFSWVWVLKKPMAFFGESYPLWKSKIDMAHTLPPDSIAFLGDSRVESDVIPAKIAPDLYDLGLDGSSPIDDFALARILVASPHPPRVVLFSINPLHCMVTEFFWSFSSEYGLLDYSTLDQIRIETRRTHELSLWSPSDIDFEHLRPIFGAPTFEDVAARLDEVLIPSGFPSYYFPSLLKGRVFLREAKNKEAYEHGLEARGYNPHGIAHGTKLKEVTTIVPDFVPSPILDLYLSKTIAVFQENNIPVYYIGTPRSDISAAAMSPRFKANFVAYLHAYERRYPNFHVLGDPYPDFSASEFSDPAHLSPEGAQLFSAHVADLLRQTGIEK